MIAEINNAKIAELIFNGIAEKIKQQGAIPIAPSVSGVGKVTLNSKSGTYAELRFVTLACNSMNGGKEKYLMYLPAETATKVAAALLKAVAKIKEEEGE